LARGGQAPRLRGRLNSNVRPHMATISHVLDVWKTTAGEHKNHWTYFITVTAAVVGFAISSTFAALPTEAKIGLALALAAFLTASAVSIYSNIRIYNAAVLELKQMSADLGVVAGALSVVPVLPLLLLHAVLDVGAMLVVVSQAFGH
jgi:hypothetical protein